MNCIFGPLPITPEQLATRVKAKVFEAAQRIDVQERNTAWTLAMKKTLAEITDGFGCKPLYTNKESKCSEFMFDFVAWEKSKSGERAVIGIESEWGSPRDYANPKNHSKIIDAIDDDFWKLLSFKAPLKVLVYTAPTNQMRRELHLRLLSDITRFTQHVIGENYLLMEFSPPAQCYCYTFEVDSDGKVENPALKPLDQASEDALKEMVMS
jgi:hypothetical protein